MLKKKKLQAGITNTLKKNKFICGTNANDPNVKCHHQICTQKRHNKSSKEEREREEGRGQKCKLGASGKLLILSVCWEPPLTRAAVGCEAAVFSLFLTPSSPRSALWPFKKKNQGEFGWLTSPAFKYQTKQSKRDETGGKRRRRQEWKRSPPSARSQLLHKLSCNEICTTMTALGTPHSFTRKHWLLYKREKEAHYSVGRFQLDCQRVLGLVWSSRDVPSDRLCGNVTLRQSRKLPWHSVLISHVLQKSTHSGLDSLMRWWRWRLLLHPLLGTLMTYRRRKKRARWGNASEFQELRLLLQKYLSTCFHFNAD